MRTDSRLSVALHVLLHMGELGRIVTSETLGPMMQMNPVVVRRTIAGLRDAGILRSEKGHGGGFGLARSLDQVTLGDVYGALGAAPSFSIGLRDPKPRCLLEKAVNRALGGALEEAEALFVARLSSLTLATLFADAARPAPCTAPRSKSKRTASPENPATTGKPSPRRVDKKRNPQHA